MEVAGLVIGVVSLWKTCVEGFEIIESARQHGMEYEILSVKLEVERVRLLTWGDSVGLSVPGEGESRRPDTRFQREEVRSAVMRLLGCIQHIFENSERLQESYGLQIATPRPQPVGIESQDQPSQTQMMLGSVFKRPYEQLLRIARERQRGSTLRRKTSWAVQDRKKFSSLVTEIRGFNDSLESLFPDVKVRSNAALMGEIDAAVGIRELQILQQATADDNEMLSESASVRLEALGATMSARTELLTASRDDADTIADVSVAAVEPGEVEEVPRPELTDAEAELGNKDEPQLTELEKRMQELEIFCDKKSTGALTLSIIGPYYDGGIVSGHVYWDGHNRSDSWPSYWEERDMGYVKLGHASFHMYRRKKFFRVFKRENYPTKSDEDHVLLDPESWAKYENANPGTVTVAGFGLECWDFALTKPKQQTIFVNSSNLPVVKAKRLLRRIDELQTKPPKLGWNPKQDELNLKEIIGDMGIVYYDQKWANDPSRKIDDLYSLLNRRDLFANFTTSSSVGMQWMPRSGDDEVLGIWNFLRQIIISKELALRLDTYDQSSISFSGFTPQVLASLIVSDQWLNNVRIILTPDSMPLADVKKADTDEERAKAEKFKEQGNAALKKKEYQRAFDLYTEAMKIDLTNAVYRCNRAAAAMALENYEGAEEDAMVATRLDAKYAKAWSRLGAAQLKQGYGKAAKESLQKAIYIAGKDASDVMRQGLADANSKIEEAVKAINDEKDDAKQHALHSEYLDQDWDIFGKTTELHSQVHEQQVEGLLMFAEKMKYPYINEVRDFVEDVYSNLRAGETINIHLHDWLYGIVLPGKWFSFKIMTALVLSTPSIRDKVRIAHYYDCGLSLPTKSYWRLSTVLGRVLGCMPGVKSLCGWIGPCPAVEFDPGLAKKPRHIHLKARQVAPIESRSREDDTIIESSGNDRFAYTRIRPGEELDRYLEEMHDSSRWIVPEPPVKQISTCTLQNVRLKNLPLDINFATEAAKGNMSDTEIENETPYRASLTFKMDDSPTPVTYKLFTNPIFVTPPPCRQGPRGFNHEVHTRELPRYQQSRIWTIEQLKDHIAEDDDEDDDYYGDGGAAKERGSKKTDVMIINATGKGAAECLARAWCSERGKNAVIRRRGGPCFVCAVRAAASLGTGVLIWVD